MRERLRPAQLLETIARMVRSTPGVRDTPLPQLDLIPKPETLETPNWWVDLIPDWPATSVERRALRRAITLAQEQFDVDWAGNR